MIISVVLFFVFIHLTVEESTCESAVVLTFLIPVVLYFPIKIPIPFPPTRPSGPGRFLGRTDGRLETVG